MTELLLTVGQVAELAAFSEMSIYRAISVGELRASKLRGRLRVRPSDLDAWIDANIVDQAAPLRLPPATDFPVAATVAEGRGLRALLEPS